jgi:acetyltransferase-like isoleucine patch superfamily enzyme
LTVERARSLELRVKDALLLVLDLPFLLRHRRAVQAARRSKIRRRSIRLLPGCTVRVGDRSILLAQVLFDRDGASLSLGDRTFVGKSMMAIASRVEIGNDVLIAWGCTIVDHDSHALCFSGRKNDVSNWYLGLKDWSRVEIEPVTIRDKVWIGLNVVILKGVTIGEGAVVAAASVVTKDVEPWTIVAGNPARVVRELSPDER